MITGKINLQLLKSVKRKERTQSGDLIDCLIIPIVANKLFVGEKGIYLDLIAFEKQNVKAGEDTHLIKQSLSKEQREKMSEDELKAMPILGNLRVSSGAVAEAMPEHTETLPEGSDLPWD